MAEFRGGSADGNGNDGWKPRPKYAAHMPQIRLTPSENTLLLELNTVASQSITKYYAQKPTQRYEAAETIAREQQTVLMAVSGTRAQGAPPLSEVLARHGIQTLPVPDLSAHPVLTRGETEHTAVDAASLNAFLTSEPVAQLTQNYLSMRRK